MLGPPRSGKGLHLVINAILDAPGAVITTATRPDNIAVTAFGDIYWNIANWNAADA